VLDEITYAPGVVSNAGSCTTIVLLTFVPSYSSITGLNATRKVTMIMANITIQSCVTET
jgi:hypothetical protein